MPNISIEPPGLELGFQFDVCAAPNFGITDSNSYIPRDRRTAEAQDIFEPSALIQSFAELDSAPHGQAESYRCCKWLDVGRSPRWYVDYGYTFLRCWTIGRGPVLACLLLSLLASFIPPTTAALVNVTVDDTYGNNDRTVIPTYTPNNSSWHLGSPTEQCDVCAMKPSEFDTSQIYDQTWHHATYFIGIPVQVSVTFHGTAVYVYNVIPNYLKGTNTYVDLSFSIDGVTVGQFTHTPDSSSTILYNHLVYANTGLSNAVHTLVMSASGSKSSLIFFDYLVYTTEVDDTAAATTSGAASSSASSNLPANTNTTPALIASSTSPGPSGSTASSPSSNSASASGSSSAPSGSSSPGSSNTALLASAASTALIASSSSSSTAMAADAPSSHSQTAAIAGGVVGGILILLVAPTLFFLICCRQRRHRSAASAVDPYNFAAAADATPPLMGGLSVRPVSRSFYSSNATGPSLTSPTIASPASSARTFETKRELELKRRMEMLQREMAAHHIHHLHHRGPETLLGSDISGGSGGSGSGESRVSVGAVQALQEEIAALRGVLSGMAAHVGHNQPAICESEILPEYEEARWSASGNVGSGISGMGPRW
ncbi:hypothetical protein V8D89_003764 [Ganoderma adspersum]